MLRSFCTSSETSITSHWQTQEPGRGVPVLCAGLAAFIHLCNGNKAGLQGQEATPAWTQDQLYLQFSLVLKMFGNRGTRASLGNLPQCLMSLVLARSPSRLTWFFLAGREASCIGCPPWVLRAGCAFLLHNTLLCVWWLLRCCLLSSFFFRLINCRLSSKVTFSRPLICLSACLCPLSGWATHWLKRSAQTWIQLYVKPSQCQV